MDKKRFLLIAGGIIFSLFLFSLLLPIYLDNVGIERSFNNSYGNYNDLWLENTHHDGTNQKVIIKTPFNNLKDINQEELIGASKKFMVEIQKYDIQKEIESIWIIFTNSQGHSIGSMWVDRQYVKKVKWKTITDGEFKKVMNFE